MVDNSNFITPEGLKEFERELEERLEIRKEIAQSIKSAKEQGDLSENAEYSEAKSKQGENERRMNWLKCVIKKAQVVEKQGRNNVELGCLVELAKKGSTASDLSFQIVGTHETNPAKGKISCESPLGKALMGKKKGNEVEFETPNGKEKYKIKEIK